MGIYVLIGGLGLVTGNLSIVLLSSFAGFIGKVVTGQIEWLFAIPIALTVIPATHAGSLLSRRVPVSRLRQALAVLIAVAAIRMWVSVLFT